ncbi:hypothetical protein RI367_002690 [Sorochytrium milnesiophthora]
MTVQEVDLGPVDDFFARIGKWRQQLPEEEYLAALRTVAALLLDNGWRLSKSYDDIFGVLTANLTAANYAAHPRIVRMSINALANAYYRCGSKIEPERYRSLFHSLRDALVHHVQKIKSDKATIEDKRVVSSTLRALSMLFAEDRQVLALPSSSEPAPAATAAGGRRRLPRAGQGATSLPSSSSQTGHIDNEALTAMVDALVHCIFRKSTDPWLSMSTFRAPIVQRLSSAQPLPLRRASSSSTSVTFSSAYAEPLLDPALNPETALMTSDSDAVSDSGTGGSRGTPSTKIRLNALVCFAALARISGKGFYPHWQRFISTTGAPSSASAPGTGGGQRPRHDLLDVMKDDPSPRVRILASTAVASLLENTRAYLSAADDTESPSSQAYSFISLSVSLGALVRRLHERLIDNIQSETTGAGLLQHIRTLTTLAANASYSTLTHDYVLDMAKCLQHLQSHSDLGVRAASFTALQSILSGRVEARDQARLEATSSAVLRSALEQLQQQPACNDDLAVPAWSVVTCIVPHSGMIPHALFMSQYPIVSQMVIDTLQTNAHCSLARRLAASKVVEHLCRRLFGKAQGDDEQDAPLPATPALPTTSSADWTLGQWLDVADGTLHLLLRSESSVDPSSGDDEEQQHALAAVACDIIGTVTNDIFAKLHRRQQLFYMTTLLTYAAPEHPSATCRASASRSLGVLASFAYLNDDVQFLHDTASTLCQLTTQDTQLSVRIRASWALACLASAVSQLLSPAIGDQPSAADELRVAFAPATLMQMLSAGLHAAHDNDKCRSNGVRVLGATLRLCGSELAGAEGDKLLQDIVGVLDKCISTGPFKSGTAPVGAIRPLVATLKRTVTDAKNFKVRINAVHALSALPSPYAFDSESVFLSVLDTFSQAADVLQNVSIAGAESRYVPTLRDGLVEAQRRMVQMGRAHGVEVHPYDRPLE